MNQRESSGLPLRAMVMVLLFLGVAFALIGWNATRPSDDTGSAEATSVATATSSTTTESTTPPPPADFKTDVWVFNTSGVDNAGSAVVDRLRGPNPNWNVPDARDRNHVEGVDVTTVYYSPVSAGDEAAARDIGRILDAPVAERLPSLDDVPLGVVVLIAGPRG